METQAEQMAVGNEPHAPASRHPLHRAKTQINVTPSPKAVVNAGDFSYFSDKGMSPLPYALSEFVDNSLAAINSRIVLDSGVSLAPNIIPGDIRISFDRSDKISTVIIWDNGCGMNVDTLKNFAIYALSPEDRVAKLNALAKKKQHSSFAEFNSNPLRINTNISMFGVGAKMSAFFIGQDLTMVTKGADSEEVLEYRCNSSEIISEYQDTGIDCYNKSINHRAPGSVADSELAVEAAAIPRLKNYIEVLEKKHTSFTYAVINGIKKDFIARFESFRKETAFNLAEVYHWYLNGHPTMKTTIGGNVSMSLLVGNFPAIDIKSTPSVIKEQMLRRKETFSFEIVDRSTDLAVFGFVCYFPFDDAETCPKESKLMAKYNGVAEPDSDDSDSDEDSGGGEFDASQQATPPIFSCWWQGRLIPMTTVESLKWMTSSFRNTTLRCRHRVRGCLFFDRTFKVTQNKSTFTEDLRSMLERAGVYTSQVDNRRGPAAKLPRSNKPIDDAFKEWMKSCHDRYDKEVMLQKKRLESEHERWRSWLEYNEMVITGKEAKSQHNFKTGDVVHIHSAPAGRKSKFGRIVKFLRANPSSADSFDTHPDKAYVSGSDRGLKCQIRTLPEFCYPNPKDQLVFVKLRMIDKTMNKDAVLRLLDARIKQQMQYVPQRLGLVIYEPGTVPRRVPAGYKFPNVDVQVLSSSSQPLFTVPFENKKLKVRQRFYLKTPDCAEAQELKMFDGFPKDKVYSFWEIDTLFKMCGSYSCVFDLSNYTTPFENVVLTKTFDFEVVAGPPACLKVLKSPANRLNLTMGAPSKGDAAVQFADKHGNTCIPDDAFLNNIVVSHEHLVVRPHPFRAVKDYVVVASIYVEPKPAEGGGFVKFNPVDITHLNIGVRGRAALIGKLPVKTTLGEPCTICWADDIRCLRVTSGGSLSTLRIRLLDRYGLPAMRNSNVKSMTISLLDSASKLNGLANRILKVDADLFDDTGLLIVPSLQINTGLDSVQLRVAIVINKGRSSAAPIELDREIIVQPGDALGTVKLSVANESSENPSFVVGSRHSLQVDLFGENGQVWAKPYSEGICKRYQFQYNADSFPLTPLGVIANVITFPQLVQNPFKISAAVVDLSEDSVNVPFKCQTEVRLVPEVGVEWKATIMRPIRCGEAIGDAIQLRYRDRFGNPCKIDANAGAKVSFTGNPVIQGSKLASFDPTGSCMMFPGIMLIGTGPGYAVLVNSQLLTKFEIIEGPPVSLSLSISDELRTFQQILSQKVLDISASMVSRSQRTFHVHALDAAGSIVSYPPNIDVKCDHATIASAAAHQPYMKSFKLAFKVPVQQQSVTVTIKCDRIPAPMVCAFPVEPWLLDVSAVNLDPLPPNVSANSPFPVIAGHLLDGGNNSILLDRNVDMLSSLSLVFTNTDNRRDLGRDLFATAVFRDNDGAFAFLARDAITMAGTYNVSVIYSEQRSDVLEVLGTDQHTLHSETAVLRVLPGKPARLWIDAEVVGEPSVVASRRPIPKVLKISVQDEFGNRVPYRFSPKDAADLHLKILDQPIDHLSMPSLSIDPSSGHIVVQSLTINPDKPLACGTYVLRFRVMTHSHLQACSLEFFYSSDARAISGFKELTSQEEKLNAELSALQTELRCQNEISSTVTDRLNTCRDSCQAIVSSNFSATQVVSVSDSLHQSKSELNSLRAEIARSTRVASVGASNHQRLQNISDFMGIIGLLGTCSNDEDCRLVSFALGNKISAPIFRKISAEDSRNLNTRHFALDLMPDRGPPTTLSRHLALAAQYGKQWITDPLPLFDLFHPSPNITPELFQSVFGGLLRNAIACKTYDDAMAFKRFCVSRRMDCGNIFTYDGRIVAVSGELGGTIPLLSRMTFRVGVEPNILRERLNSCKKRIHDFEQHEQLVAEQRRLLEQQNAVSDRMSNIEQEILKKEQEISAVRSQIEAVDPNASATVGRKRRRVSASGPTIRRKRL